MTAIIQLNYDKNFVQTSDPIDMITDLQLIIYFDNSLIY